MAFGFGEVPNSRGGEERTSQSRKYFATGTSDEVFIEAYAQANIPAAIVTASATLYRQPLKIEFESSNYAIITADYALKGEGESQVGSLKWSFDTTGGTVNIKAALTHMADYPAGATNHQGSIGVTKDGVEGTDIIIPALKLNVSFSHPLGQINLAKAVALARGTGTSNESSFMGFAAGEVLFLGASGSDGTDAPAEISYQFACSENLQNHVIATINGITKAGWDYAWVEFKDSTDAGKPAKIPLAVHVERVYRRIDMAGLVGFG